MSSTKRIKTGLIRFDEMIGGGILEGSRIEIYGREDCGKSTFALEVSKAFKKPYMIDFEHKMSEEYAQIINPELSEKKGNLLRGNTLEESLDTFLGEFEDILKKNIARKKKKEKEVQNFDLLIIDTIGSASTLELIESKLSDKKRVGSLARAVTDFLRNKAEKILTPYGCTTLMLNHKKPTIGAKPFEEQSYTPGGIHLSYSAQIRIAMGRKANRIYEDGITASFWQKKNHTTMTETPKNCEYIIRRGHGIVRGFESLLIGIENGIIKEEGTSYVIGDEKFRGQKAIADFLNETPELQKAIYEAHQNNQG